LSEGRAHHKPGAGRPQRPGRLSEAGEMTEKPAPERALSVKIFMGAFVHTKVLRRAFQALLASLSHNKNN